MGNAQSIEGPGTELSDIGIMWFVEPVAYFVISGVFTAGFAMQLRKELKAPRSKRITNMQKIALATSSVALFYNTSIFPPIYNSPHCWRLEVLARFFSITVMGALVVHFVWIVVMADYESNIKKDPRGQKRFTKLCVKAMKGASLLHLVSAVGTMATGKEIWTKFDYIGMMIVLGIVARGLYSFYKIHKRCQENLRADIALRIKTSKTSSKKEKSLVSSKKNFDVSKVELTRNELHQQDRIGRIRKKVLLLLPIDLGCSAVMFFKFAFDWDFDKDAFLDMSQPFEPDMEGPLVVMCLAYTLWYFHPKTAQ